MNPFDAKNPFMTACIKGAEARVVDSDHLSRMLKASGVKDLLAVIRDTHLGQYLENPPPKSFDEADEGLWRYLGDNLQEMRALRQLPRDMRRVLEAYLVKYDVANIRAVLRTRPASGRAARLVPLGVLRDRGRLADLAGCSDPQALAALLDESGLKPYASIVRRCRPADEPGARLALEAGLYREYYRGLLAAARRSRHGALLARAFGGLIDLANIQMAVRAIVAGIGAQAADFLLEGGTLAIERVRELTGAKLAEVPGRLEGTSYREAAEEFVAGYAGSRDAGAIEETLEKHRFRLVRDALSQRLLSPALIGWYLVLKEVEMRNVRLLLKAAFDDLPLDGVRGRLVMV